jgi:hypothetical protein
MEFRIPKAGDIYRHFKGNLYEIIIIARDSETLEEKVVYKSVNGDDAYVRSLTMFLSPVDRVKYPNVEQEFRFEFVSREQKTVSDPVNVEEIEAPVLENSTLIMDFLDKETTNEKMQFLLQNKDYMSDAFLSVAAQSLDFTESKATLEERFDDIMRYLRTVSKYENTRFR